MKRQVIALVLLALPLGAQACRCEQRPLADYFRQAAYVAMARLTAATEEPGRRVLEFELLAPPYKGDADVHTAGTVARFATPTSTAGCGIQPDVNAVYVVFAEPAGDDAGMPRVNSCNGTRVHLSSRLEEPAGFIDVPARFVAGQLNGLLGLEVLRDVAASAPRPGDPAGARLIGLLELGPLADGEYLNLYSEPSASAGIAGQIRAYGDVAWREFAYEQPGAIVYARLPGWFRLRLADRSFGWLPAGDAGSFFAYQELPIRRLAYLTAEWSGLTWPGPGSGIPTRHSLATRGQRREYPVDVLESMDVGGLPWFRVRLLGDGPCSGENTASAHAGWIPAYGRRGDPNVWFYSRGC